MSFVKKTPRSNWRDKLTDAEVGEVADLEREAKRLDEARRQVTYKLRAYRDRCLKRAIYVPAAERSRAA